MKQLKIKSLYKITIALFVFTYVLIITQNNIHNSYYTNETSIKGTITSLNIKEDSLKITLLAREKIIVNYYFKDIEEIKHLQLGDYIKINGELIKPKPNTNFNLFNYQKYLMSKKIYWTFKCNKIVKLKENTNILYSIKNKIINRIDTYKSKDYLYTFIMGDNSNIEEEIKTSYQNNGISHLLAISGMHITLLSAIILFILKKFIKENISYILVSIFLIFYMFLTNFSASVIRSSLLFIFLFINKKYKLKIKTFDILLIIFLMLLLYNPYYIYDLGFKFSFLISFVLIKYGNIINNYTNYFIKIFITSILSFLGSLPIMLNNFFQVNLLSPFLNIIFVPLISLIIFPLSLLTLFIKPLDNILIILLKLFENLSTICDIDTFKLILGKNNLLLIIYIIIILYTLKHLKKGIILLLIILLIHSNINFNNNTITFLDVGQGDSTLITYNNINILIDTGGIEGSSKEYNYPISKNTIIPYLKSVGIKKLDYLILTHGDFDHAGEAYYLINNLKIDKVIFNNNSYNKLETNLINLLNKKKIKFYKGIQNINIKSIKLSFLNTDIFENENDDSNVIYMKLNKYKFLFMGDASIKREESILDKYNYLNIDVLKVGHHGSKTSSSLEFIKKADPKYSIISVGKNNKYGHPNKEVLDNLEDTIIYRTDINGSIKFKITNKLKIATCF